jgi:hypothetical protein
VPLACAPPAYSIEYITRESVDSYIGSSYFLPLPLPQLFAAWASCDLVWATSASASHSCRNRARSGGVAAIVRQSSASASIAKKLHTACTPRQQRLLVNLGGAGGSSIAAGGGGRREEGGGAAMHTCTAPLTRVTEVPVGPPAAAAAPPQHRPCTPPAAEPPPPPAAAAAADAPPPRAHAHAHTLGSSLGSSRGCHHTARVRGLAQTS